MCVNNHCRLTMPTFGPATLGMCWMPLLLAQRRLCEGWPGTFSTREPVRTEGKSVQQGGRGSWVFWPIKTLTTWVETFNLFNVYLSNQVSNQLDVESARLPTDPGSSQRRNRFLNRLSSSSFQKIVKEKLIFFATELNFPCSEIILSCTTWGEMDPLTSGRPLRHNLSRKWWL